MHSAPYRQALLVSVTDRPDTADMRSANSFNHLANVTEASSASPLHVIGARPGIRVRFYAIVESPMFASLIFASLIFASLIFASLIFASLMFASLIFASPMFASLML